MVEVVIVITAVYTILIISFKSFISLKSLVILSVRVLVTQTFPAPRPFNKVILNNLL